MATTIRMTYMGSCTYDGTTFAVNSMDATVEQTPQVYDHIVGLRDKFDDEKNKGQETSDTSGGGENTIQKRIYRYSSKLPKATLSGPITAPETGVSPFETLLDHAISGVPADGLFVFWSDGKQYEMTNGVVSNLSITVEAGGASSFTAEIIGEEMEDGDGTTVEVDCTKILTWDRVLVNATNITGDLSGFSVTIANPIQPIYTSEKTNLFPKTLRIGTQGVTGSISAYEFHFKPDAGALEFRLGPNGQTYKLKTVAYHPGSASASGATPFISTVGFTGVDDDALWEVS
jgi:hypothetical protein